VTRSGARRLLVAGLGLAILTMCATVVAALTPSAANVWQVHVASVTSLRPEGRAILVEVRGLEHLDRAAARLRGCCLMYEFGVARASKTAGLPVYVTRSADEVHAFIGVDPRNGCALEYLQSGPVLHDVCHGSIYDLKGQRVGGPSPFSLDELVITIHNGLIYADATKVIPGRWLAGTR
jgi:Rieske Fe-S protein